jgi:hypothetical protein
VRTTIDTDGGSPTENATAPERVNANASVLDLSTHNRKSVAGSDVKGGFYVF